jgi:hypothetical protein
MLWYAVGLAVLSVAALASGFVLYANATGVAPHRRTQDDPTGVKRASARVEWSDLFRRIPSGLRVTLDENADRSDRLAAVASLLVLVAGLVAVVALLALLATFV